MFQETALSGQTTFFQKLRSLDYILLFCLIILGLVSSLSMYSTEGGEVLQADFIKPLIAGKKIESVGRNLLKQGLSSLYNDDGAEVQSLIRALGITEEDEEVLLES